MYPKSFIDRPLETKLAMTQLKLSVRNVLGIFCLIIYFFKHNNSLII